MNDFAWAVALLAKRKVDLCPVECHIEITSALVAPCRFQDSMLHSYESITEIHDDVFILLPPPFGPGAANKLEHR
jgi:hypothetical protein